VGEVGFSLGSKGGIRALGELEGLLQTFHVIMDEKEGGCRLAVICDFRLLAVERAYSHTSTIVA
jgi:hypothetical protein